MSLIGYIWDASDSIGRIGWLAVSVPIPDAPIWSAWALRQDPSMRKYDPQMKVWYFHKSLKREIEARFIHASWAVRYESPFSRAKGKPHKQEQGYSAGHPPVLVMPSDYYSVLYVTQDAPIEVVKAAFRALMLLHHPDHKGSEEKAKQLTEAKEKIFQERGW